MDELAFHPYEDTRASTADGHAPDEHDDRARRLRQARRAARTGVRRDGPAGSTLPILYDEFGWRRRSRARRSPDEPTTKPVTRRRRRATTEALALAYCQPTARSCSSTSRRERPPLAVGSSTSGRRRRASPLRRHARADASRRAPPRLATPPYAASRPPSRLARRGLLLRRPARAVPRARPRSSRRRRRRGPRPPRGTGRYRFAAWRTRPRQRRRVAPTRLASRATSGQYVAYGFYRVDPAWRRLPIEERAAHKDAFAEVVEEWAAAMHSLRAFSTTGVRPETRLLPLEDHRALRGPGRARRRAERDAARGLAGDAVLVPRDDEGVAVHLRARARKIDAARARPTSSSTRS